MKILNISLLALLLISTLFFTRFFGNSYDNYGHQHPDERWLVMVVGKLHLFDQLNPDFFAYGSLPMYILKGVAQGGEAISHTPIDNYDGLLIWGRRLTSLMDVGVVALVGVITWQITRKRKTAIMGSMLYALMFFPIQNSNFFIVDNFVNFFFAVTLVCLFAYLRKPSIIKLTFLGISYAAVISSKITPVLFAPVLLTLISLAQISKNQSKQSRKDELNDQITAHLQASAPTERRSEELPAKLPRILKLVLQIFVTFVIFGIVVALCTFLFMPYSFLRFDQFLKELLNQLAMNGNAYVFPYTLQYVTTQPYLYYLKNIFCYGAGPVLSILAVLGIGISIGKTILTIAHQYRPTQTASIQKKISSLCHIFVSTLTQDFAFVYIMLAGLFFLVIGKSAVKFMRYLLLLYPFFAVMGALAIQQILQSKRLPWRISRAIVLILLASATLWTTSFLHIYLQPHTRIQATDWMIKHIPAGSTLAVEHWDDRLPLSESERFQYVEMPLYEQPDDRAKWELVNQRLAQADYIVLASNRLFTPLPKLASCARFEKCYPLTAEYYRQLFSGELGFAKVAEFTARPTLPKWLGGLEINDDNADESFTVYDHPHVIIFKKTTLPF